MRHQWSWRNFFVLLVVIAAWTMTARYLLSLGFPATLIGTLVISAMLPSIRKVV